MTTMGLFEQLRQLKYLMWGKGTGNKHKWQVQNRQGEVENKQYRKWRSQRTYMYDPWT